MIEKRINVGVDDGNGIDIFVMFFWSNGLNWILSPINIVYGKQKVYVWSGFRIIPSDNISLWNYVYCENDIACQYYEEKFSKVSWLVITLCAVSDLNKQAKLAVCLKLN